MKIRLTRGSVESLKHTLRWTQRVLLGVAAVLFGYCALTLLDSRHYQEQQSRYLDQLPPAEQAGGIGRQVDQLPQLADGLIGRIEVARIGLSVVVAEGVTSKTLRKAAGHIPGTALPGQGGNVGIAGHRDTFFRPLEGIRINDLVVLTTRAGEYRYRVVFSEVVTPNDVAVLDPTGSDILTLVTCHPFYFVGPAPNRFIVRAARV